MFASQVAGHQHRIETSREYSDETIAAVSTAISDLISDDALAAFCSVNTVERYLKARNGDVNAAIAMLR